MIVCALLQFMAGQLNLVYLLLPPWAFDLEEVTGALGTNMYVMNSGEITTTGLSPIVIFFRFLAGLNTFLPIDHMFYALQFLATTVAVALVFRGVKLVINVIRGAHA